MTDTIKNELEIITNAITANTTEWLMEIETVTEWFYLANRCLTHFG
ncbi:hypothetical protein FACS1894190_03510 [Spirochaetia bacterium]|nr:hypothetical protein FACS1894190_03510 [Spirochaetia bacterium]